MINPTVYGLRRGCRDAALALVSLLIALPALAASPRLDEANAHLVKTAALLRAAASPGEGVNVRIHREQAIRLVEQAEREITLAKQADTQQGSPGPHAMPRTNPTMAPHLR